MKITIANYGIGNILSVQRAFEHLGAQVILAHTAKEIRNAQRLVVPGVGAFKNCMDALESFDIKNTLIEFANSGKPYLGICVGMQMLMDKSFEFGEHPGLGIIAGDVKKIDVIGQRVPFIGWKKIEMNKKFGTYYFIHSYQAIPAYRENLLATYALDKSQITAAIIKNNVLGVQFHPEKSAEDGLRLLKYFLTM